MSKTLKLEIPHATGNQKKRYIKNKIFQIFVVVFATFNLKNKLYRPNFVVLLQIVVLGAAAEDDAGTVTHDGPTPVTSFDKKIPSRTTPVTKTAAATAEIAMMADSLSTLVELLEDAVDDEEE